MPSSAPLDLDGLPLAALFRDAGFPAQMVKRIRDQEIDWKDDPDAHARIAGLDWLPARAIIAQPPEPPPPVHVAIARVMADLPGIGKDDRSPEGYLFRGIEAIVGNLQDVCARHGVVYWSVEEIVDQLDNEQINMNPGWIEMRLRLTWYVQGPAGDFLMGPKGELPVTYGQGRDKSDKQIAKARTQARKGFLNTIFNIGDKREETESQDPPGDDQYQNHSSGGGGRRQQQAPADQPPEASPKQWIDQDTRQRLFDAARGLTADQQAWIRAQWMAEDPMGEDDTYLPVADGKPSWRHLTVGMVRQVESLIAQARKRPAGEPQSDPAGAEAPTDPPAPPAQEKPEEDPTDGEQQPTSWNEIVDGVRALTEQQLIDRLNQREIDYEHGDLVKMRAALVNDIGAKAGLSLASIKTDADAARATNQETPAE